MTDLLLIAMAIGADPAPADLEFFEKKVRPVLVAACFECHGGGKKIRGGLTLTNRAGLLRGGDSGPSLVPGEPGKSRLITAVRYTDELKMPPRGKLSAEQIADLTRWVAIGAPWPADTKTAATARVETFDLADRKQSHWAWQPLAVVPPPTAKDAGWTRNPIDRFIFARLEAAGLTPALPADRRTLLRRITLDLTGLPPTRAEIRDFLADQSPDAYEKVVDRLLSSPAYGERWGRHWLDLVRYAETRGHEFDFDISEAWRYRDYVIRAFNEDVPYDQLVREHVAGDLMREPRRHPVDGTNESILGTGFWFLSEGKHSPVDIKLDGDERRDNMLDVFGKTFLGLTIACARCHDHKFDAISTADYYALVGYLQSIGQQRAFLDSPASAGSPEVELRRAVADRKAAAVTETADRMLALVERLPEAWSTDRFPIDPKLTGELVATWRRLVDATTTADSKIFVERRRRLVSDRSARAQRDAPAVVPLPAFHTSGSSHWSATGPAFSPWPPRNDLLLRPDGTLDRVVPPTVAHSGLVSPRLRGVLRSPTFLLDKKRLWIRAAGQGVQVRLVIDGYQIIRSPLHGHFEYTLNSPAKANWHAIDLAMGAGMHGYLELVDDGDGWIALDGVALSDAGPPEDVPNTALTALLDDNALTDPPALARKLQVALRETIERWTSGSLPPGQVGADRVAWLNELLALVELPKPTADVARQVERIRQLERSLPEPSRGLAAVERPGLDEYIHIRGNPKNRGPVVPRRFLEAVAGREQPAPQQGSGRLELVDRLLAPSNPLLSRVIVNRLWHHHFGRGIVASVDDFGVQGERPTHPELLDWLAAELPRRNWSLKAMHRLLVTSAAYRMASRGDPAADAADPTNRLLHRMNLRRLEGETIRDAVLAVSGRLDRSMGGPGVLPHLTPFLVGRGRPASGPLDGNGRRSVYLAVRRNFLNPFFLAFDTPIPFTTIGRRSVSNVPAQALALLNNPLLVQQAQRWADRVLSNSTPSREDRIRRMYEEAFGRLPTESELRDAVDFLTEQQSATDRQAWADFAHVLLNVKEFIYVN